MQFPNDNPSVLRSPARTNLGTVVVGAHRGLAAKQGGHGASPLGTAKKQAERRYLAKVYARKLVANRQLARAQGVNLLHTHKVQEAVDRMPGMQEQLASLVARVMSAREEFNQAPLDLVEEVEKEFP